MKVVIDTSVFVDYTRAGIGLLLTLIKSAKSGKTILYVPSVVILEIWAGESMSGKEDEKIARRLLQSMKVLQLTRQIAEIAGRLAREKKVEDFIDAAICATTLYFGAQLATNNVKHFEKVEGLRIFKVSKN